eukprot:1160079-Pelagomonas_calceolata.AAC.3
MLCCSSWHPSGDCPHSQAASSLHLCMQATEEALGDSIPTKVERDPNWDFKEEEPLNKGLLINTEARIMPVKLGISTDTAMLCRRRLQGWKKHALREA